MASTVYSCADCGFWFTVNEDEQAETLSCPVCLELVDADDYDQDATQMMAKGTKMPSAWAALQKDKIVEFQGPGPVGRSRPPGLGGHVKGSKFNGR